MATVVEQPSKDKVRAWFNDRRDSDTPPPEPGQIRQELGWHLVEGYDRNQQDHPR